MKMVKAFLIDPYALKRHVDDQRRFPMSRLFEEAIKEIEVDASDYRSYYPILSEPEVHDVSTFTLVPLSYCDRKLGEDGIYVDDEGLWNHGDGFFLLRGYPQPLAGKGLVLGPTSSGNSCAPRKTTLEWLRANVQIGYTNMSFFYKRPQHLGIIFGDHVARHWSKTEAWDKVEAWV